MSTNIWMQDQVNFITVNYADMSNEAIAQRLGRSVDAVKKKATVLGLKKRSRLENYHCWTSQDDSLIAEEYPEGDLQALADKIGVKITKLYRRALLIGVKRNPLLVLEQCKKAGAALASKNLGKRFQKGHQSCNKGRKMPEWMSEDAISRVKKTQFTKGQKPHNTRPIGFERVSKDGYLGVKVQCSANSRANYVAKHRLEYIKHFGPIPKGMIVEFADGDKRNFSPDNLVLKSRVQNVRDNGLKDSAIVKRFLKIKDPEEVQRMIAEHPELIELKRNAIKLNGAIKRIAGPPAGTRR